MMIYIPKDMVINVVSILIAAMLFLVEVMPYLTGHDNLPSLLKSLNEKQDKTLVINNEEKQAETAKNTKKTEDIPTAGNLDEKQKEITDKEQIKTAAVKDAEKADTQTKVTKTIRKTSTRKTSKSSSSWSKQKTGSF